MSEICGSGADAFLVGYVRCCRVWPVSLHAPVGACGLCGEVPVSEPTPGGEAPQ